MKRSDADWELPRPLTSNERSDPLMKPNRREFFRTLGTAAADFGVGPVLLSSSCKSAVEDKDRQDAQVLFNRMRAFHCLDICFWFHNTDLMLTHTGGGARPRTLSEKMAGSLLRFMREGNPNGGGLPDWPQYSSENGETMILNDVSEVKNDPDREARNALPA